MTGANASPAETADSLFHKLWTKAVGLPTYVKDEWRQLEKHVVRLPAFDKFEFVTEHPSFDSLAKRADGLWSVMLIYAHEDQTRVFRSHRRDGAVRAAYQFLKERQ